MLKWDKTLSFGITYLRCQVFQFQKSSKEFSFPFTSVQSRESPAMDSTGNKAGAVFEWRIHTEIYF